MQKRKVGYYALPMLWRDDADAVGPTCHWRTARDAKFGYVDREPKEKLFRTELEKELDSMQKFCGLS